MPRPPQVVILPIDRAFVLAPGERVRVPIDLSLTDASPMLRDDLLSGGPDNDRLFPLGGDDIVVVVWSQVLAIIAVLVGLAVACGVILMARLGQGRMQHLGEHQHNGDIRQAAQQQPAQCRQLLRSLRPRYR